jgi:hypothetical protein
VQKRLSLQFLGAPGKQFPLLQASPTVQSLPVLHEPEAGVRTQPPAAGSQLSVVQTLPSLQLAAGWPHCPVAGSQVSWVQGLASSQLCGVPWQTMAPPASGAQVSPLVHRLPSSQLAPPGSADPTQCPKSSHWSVTVQLF